MKRLKRISVAGATLVIVGCAQQVSEATAPGPASTSAVSSPKPKVEGASGEVKPAPDPATSPRAGVPHINPALPTIFVAGDSDGSLADCSWCHAGALLRSPERP